MPKPDRSLVTIFLIVFIDLLGFGIILPLLPYIAENFHASAAKIGLLTATYSLFQFISAPILGKLSDRFGRKKILILSQIGSVFGYLLLGFAHSLPLLFLSRFIDGATGGNISIAQAYIADVTNKTNRAKGMGVLGAAFGLGFIFGPAIGGLLAKISYSTPAFFAAGIGLVTVIATQFLLKESVNLKTASVSSKTKFSWYKLRKILTTQPIGVLIIAFFLISLAFSSLQAFFALWTEHNFNYGPVQNGYFFAFIGIFVVITQLKILPLLLKKFSEAKLLKIGVLLLSGGLFILGFAAHPILIYPSLILNALGNGLTNPTIQSLASENVPPEEYGETLGIFQSFASLGRIFGPIMGGILFTRFGPESPFLISGLIVFLVFLLLFKRLA